MGKRALRNEKGSTSKPEGHQTTYQNGRREIEHKTWAGEETRLKEKKHQRDPQYHRDEKEKGEKSRKPSKLLEEPR